MDRRTFLYGLGLAGAAAVAGPSVALAGGTGDPRLVVLLLRGGLDGLAAVPAIGDPAFAAARGAEAASGALPLDGMFGLHPALGPLRPYWDRRELLVVHATACPYADHSHFDAQDVLETGHPTPHAAVTGWLNRALAGLSGGPAALVGGRQIPLLLRGPSRATSTDLLRAPRVPEPLLARISDLYAGDALLGAALAEGIATEKLLAASRGTAAGKTDADGALVLGQVMALDDGPRIAALELGGFDTHTGQDRVLGGRLADLAATIDALARGLGPAWRHTVVVAATEFGRTVRPNGTGGTDHGVGGAALLAGGALAGGRVVADWPGLGAAALLEGRDLRPTTDLRAVFAGILRDHLGVSEAALARDVFPGSGRLPALDGLVLG